MVPRYQLGDELEVVFQVRDDDGVPSLPDAAPLLRIYTSVGVDRTLMELKRVPPVDRQDITGWFGTTVLLDAEVNANVSAWSGATTYVIGDAVKYGGTVYRCILGHTNQVPPNATYWALYDLASQFQPYIVEHYWWRASWAVSGVAGAASGYFEIVAGGDTDGPIDSLDFIDRRGSTHLLQHVSERDYLMGRNPRV